MFPIIFYQKGAKLPKDGTYYIVAANGTFIHKDTGLIEAVAEVEGVGFLNSYQPWVKHNFPLLPSFDVKKIILFFQRVCEVYDTEAIVLIHFSEETNTYLFHCPYQEVSSANVDYNSEERFDNYQLIGDIHSHNEFTASHSPTDKEDETNFDGLHITVGNLDQPYFSISCSLTVNQTRFLIPPAEIISGIKKVKWTLPLKKYYPLVNNFFQYYQGNFQYNHDQKGSSRAVLYPNTQFWNIECNRPIEQIPHNWFNRLKKKKIDSFPLYYE
ncbi:hypothetical protein ACFL1Y_00090 [Patescibacteria group bacterium]